MRPTTALTTQFPAPIPVHISIVVHEISQQPRLVNSKLDQLNKPKIKQSKNTRHGGAAVTTTPHRVTESPLLEWVKSHHFAVFSTVRSVQDHLGRDGTMKRCPSEGKAYTTSSF